MLTLKKAVKAYERSFYMKQSKRFLAVIIAAIMLTMTFLPTVSAASYTQKVPHIDFRGFMSYTVYEDKDNPDSERIFPPSTQTIIETAAGLVPALGKLALDNNWDAFGDVFIPVLNHMLDPIAFTGEGVPVNNSGVHFTYPTKEELIENNLDIDFQYDWRDDPYKSAAELNDLINYLTDELGYSQVTLESHSYAGIVMLVYLSTYGTAKVKGCCFNATAVYGAQFAGELVKGNVTISNEALVEFLKGLFDHNEYEAVISALADLLSQAGVTGFIADFATNLFVNLSDRIWTQSILPALGNWPSIWAMVPDEDFEEGYNRVFNELYADSDIDFSGLNEKIDAYNNDIRINRENRLVSANDSTNLYVIARYGYSGVPLGDIWTSNTDTVLNASAESFGATCKDYDYSDEETNTERYISPNGAVDASTCLFPDQTWFIRDCKHTQRETAIIDFAKTLLNSDGQATIDTYEDYPQFLVFDSSTEIVTPDDNETHVKNSILSRIVEFFRNLYAFIKKLIKK